MITVARAAKAAIRITAPPGSQSATCRNHCGGGSPEMTLSRTILSGHGAARLIAVSTPVASRMTASQPRYGRSSSAIRRPIPLGRGIRSVFAAIVDDLVRSLQPKAGGEIERGVFFRAHYTGVERESEDRAGSGCEEREPDASTDAIVPERRALSGEEHAARVGEPEDAIAERQEYVRLSQRDAQLGVAHDRGITSEAVQIEPAQHSTAERRIDVEPGRQRRAADEGGVEKWIPPPVPLPGDAQVEEDVRQDARTHERRRLAAELGKGTFVVENRGRVAHFRQQLEAAQRREIAGARVHRDAELPARERQAAGAIRLERRDDPRASRVDRLDHYARAAMERPDQRHVDGRIREEPLLPNVVEARAGLRRDGLVAEPVELGLVHARIRRVEKAAHRRVGPHVRAVLETRPQDRRREGGREIHVDSEG